MTFLQNKPEIEKNVVYQRRYRDHELASWSVWSQCEASTYEYMKNHINNFPKNDQVRKLFPE